jgi:hypothetical protein
MHSSRFDLSAILHLAIKISLNLVIIMLINPSLENGDVSSSFRFEELPRVKPGPMLGQVDVLPTR